MQVLIQQIWGGWGLRFSNSNNQLYMWVLSRFSRVQLFATPCTVAHQAPLLIGFSRQEYWSGLPCPPPGDLPDTGIELVSPMSQGANSDSPRLMLWVVRLHSFVLFLHNIQREGEGRLKVKMDFREVLILCFPLHA